jgi:predicted XRE-type DNA-binding protein
MSESGKVKIFTEEHRRNIGKANEGELHPNHKLTNEQIFEIKKLLVEGNLSQAKIAILFNVQGNAISRIKNGKTWKHIII